MAKTRSPLKALPLRLPGQSVQQEFDELLAAEILTFVWIMVFAFVWPAQEWLRWLTKAPPSPWPVTVIAALAFAYANVRWVRAQKKLNALKLGRDGEREVAEELDKLKEKGAIVFHDIVATGFNVDHVVLSRHGIYAIETKTFSKDPRAKVFFDGKTLLVGGRPPGRDPIAQAVAIADWVKVTLKTMTTKEYPVRPVLVFPGWYVNPVREHGGARVWVLNPKNLGAFIPMEPMVVSEEDLKSAAYFLARYIKTTPDTR